MRGKWHTFPDGEICMQALWAEEATKLNQVPDIEKNRLAWIDSSAWLIQFRLIAVAQNFLEKRQPKQPKTVKLPRDPNTTLELLGHIPCPLETRDRWWYCSLGVQPRADKWGSWVDAQDQYVGIHHQCQAYNHGCSGMGQNWCTMERRFIHHTP